MESLEEQAAARLRSTLSGKKTISRLSWSQVARCLGDELLCARDLKPIIGEAEPDISYKRAIKELARDLIGGSSSDLSLSHLAQLADTQPQDMEAPHQLNCES